MTKDPRNKPRRPTARSSLQAGRNAERGEDKKATREGGISSRADNSSLGQEKDREMAGLVGRNVKGRSLSNHLSKTQLSPSLPLESTPIPTAQGVHGNRIGLTGRWWVRNHASFLTATLIICLLNLVTLPSARGGPKGISKAEIDSIAPTQSSLRQGPTRHSKEANFEGKMTNKKWLKRTRPQASDNGSKRGKTDSTLSKLPVVNIISWNVNSSKDELRQSYYLITLHPNGQTHTSSCSSSRI